MDIACTKILVVGASSDIAQPLVAKLKELPIRLGLHANSRPERVAQKEGSKAECKPIQRNLLSPQDAIALVNEFADWAKGIDGLVQLCGGIHCACNWSRLGPEDWEKDLSINLTIPFFLTQQAYVRMEHGGRIILVGTASASKGGGTKSLAYGVAKSGVETIVKGTARQCGQKGILINAICPGFISTSFHKVQAQKTDDEIADRSKNIPVGRAGTPEDVASLIGFLLSTGSSFITGQCIKIDGGDFI